MNKLLSNLALFVIVLTAITACKSPPDASPVRDGTANNPIRVACVGDSITYGFGIPDREHDSYPAQLQRYLGESWQVQNFGFNGATALERGTKPYSGLPVYREALAYRPNVVVLKLGTNDTNARSWPEHKDEFVADYLALVKSFQKLETKPRIYICLPVPLFRDRGKTYDTDQILVDEVIPKLKQIADDAKLPVIDLYQALESHSDLLPDGVHPNTEGARIMARTIAGALTAQPAKRF
jgi:lysophospholipase L1-like esterase